MHIILVLYCVSSKWYKNIHSSSSASVSFAAMQWFSWGHNIMHGFIFSLGNKWLIAEYNNNYNNNIYLGEQLGDFSDIFWLLSLRMQGTLMPSMTPANTVQVSDVCMHIKCSYTLYLYNLCGYT